jgi:hypothetical protein
MQGPGAEVGLPRSLIRMTKPPWFLKSRVASFHNPTVAVGPGSQSAFLAFKLQRFANMGIERIPPGIPRIQNQKTSEMITRTGLRVNRLARSIGVKVSPSIK